MSINHRSQKGFTLVELLIVVIILGILAAVVIPQFNSAASESKEAALASNLATVRQAIEMYKVQHTDQFPTDLGGATTGQLVNKTDVVGAIDPAGLYGPYLRNAFPSNPVSGATSKNSVALVTTMPGAGDDSTGWVYNTATGEFRANTPLAGPSGTLFYDL